MSKLSTRLVIAASAALSYFAFVQAQTPNCDPVEETIIVQPESTSYRVIPGEYDWVEGEIAGYAQVYKLSAPRFENGKLVEEAYPISSFTAYEVVGGRTRIQTKRPEFEAFTIPAKMVTHSRAGACNIVSSSKSDEEDA